MAEALKISFFLHIRTGIHSLIHLFDHSRYIFESLPCVGFGLDTGEYKDDKV